MEVAGVQSPLRIRTLGFKAICGLLAAQFPQIRAFLNSPECPCIDVRNLTTLDAHGCLEQEVYPHTCLPSNYGSSECTSWNADLLPECTVHDGTKEAIELCTFEWCFVDRHNCNRTSHPSQISTSEIEPEALYFSYTTCGYVEPFRVSSSKERAMSKSPLRITYPGDDYYWLNTVEGGLKEGVVVDMFVKAMHESHDVEYVEVPLLNRSREQYPTSTYSACTHQVALGESDLCIGNFWVTSERLSMTTFASPYHTFTFFVYVIKDDGEMSFSELMSRPFLPFSFAAWGLLLASFVLLSTVMFLLERELIEDKKTTNQKMRATLEQIVTRIAVNSTPEPPERPSAAWISGVERSSQAGKYTEGHPSAVCEKYKRRNSENKVYLEELEWGGDNEEEDEQVGRFEWWTQVAKDFFSNLYLTLLTFTQTSSLEPKTRLGRFLLLFYGFFVLVIIATYTANLAAFLTTEAQDSPFSGLDEVLAAHASICAMSAIHSVLENRFPGIGKLLVAADDFNPFDGMDSGKCDVAISYESEFEVIQSGSTVHCNKGKTGDAILLVQGSIPVAPKLQFTTSSLIRRYEESGELSSSIEKHKREFLGSGDYCTLSDEEEETQKMGVNELAGLFILLLIGMGISLTLATVQKVYRNVRAHWASRFVPQVIEVKQKWRDAKSTALAAIRRDNQLERREAPVLPDLVT